MKFSTILRRKPKFRGKFFQFRVIVDEHQDKGYQNFLLVFSSGKQEVVRRALWLKWLWNNLTREEYTLFILMLKESNSKEWSALKAVQFLRKKTLRQRVIQGETYLGEKVSSRLSYLGSRRINIEIQYGTQRLIKVPKYSGYVRSIAALGKTKRGSVLSYEDLIENTEYVEKMIFPWERFLSVGELPYYPVLATGKQVILPDET